MRTSTSDCPTIAMTCEPLPPGGHEAPFEISQCSGLLMRCDVLLFGSRTGGAAAFHPDSERFRTDPKNLPNRQALGWSVKQTARNSVARRDTKGRALVAWYHLVEPKKAAPARASAAPSSLASAANRVRATESPFAKAINGLLQQNRHIPEVPALLVYVGCWGKTGRHLLAMSSSHFDPSRPSAPLSGCKMPAIPAD
jgi:hypothetical protein